MNHRLRSIYALGLALAALPAAATRMIGSDLSLGVTVYGNGGLNTSYPQGDCNCGGGPAWRGA